MPEIRSAVVSWQIGGAGASSGGSGTPRGVRSVIVGFLPLLGITAGVVVGGNAQLAPIVASGTGQTGSLSGPDAPQQIAEVGVRTSASAVLNPAAGTAAITLSTVQATGSNAQTTPRGLRSGALPWLLLPVGSSASQVAATGATALTPVVAAGTGRVAGSGQGALVLGGVIASGTGGAFAGASGALLLDSVGASGTGRIEVRGQAGIALGAMQVASGVSTEIRASGLIQLGEIAGTGYASIPITGSAEIKLGAVSASGAFFEDKFGGAAINLRGVSAQGRASVGSASVTDLSASGGLYRRRFRGSLQKRGLRK
jgi:hypothetical protein